MKIYGTESSKLPGLLSQYLDTEHPGKSTNSVAPGDFHEYLLQKHQYVIDLDKLRIWLSLQLVPRTDDPGSQYEQYLEGFIKTMRPGSRLNTTAFYRYLVTRIHLPTSLYLVRKWYTLYPIPVVAPQHPPINLLPYLAEYVRTTHWGESPTKATRFYTYLLAPTPPLSPIPPDHPHITIGYVREWLRENRERVPIPKFGGEGYLEKMEEGFTKFRHTFPHDEVYKEDGTVYLKRLQDFLHVEFGWSLTYDQLQRWYRQSLPALPNT